MCNYSDSIEQQALEKCREQGIEQGIEQSRIECIKNLMESLKVNVKQAMNLLGIPEKERTKYASLVQE